MSTTLRALAALKQCIESFVNRVTALMKYKVIPYSPNDKKHRQLYLFSSGKVFFFKKSRSRQDSEKQGCYVVSFLSQLSQKSESAMGDHKGAQRFFIQAPGSL